MIGRMSSMRRFDAASTSITSGLLPSRIDVHSSQVPHGSGVGPRSQLRQRARMRADVVLPTPRLPANRNACGTVFCASACRSEASTASWPTISAHVVGRNRRATTW